MLWMGRGIWTCGTMILRKQIPCFVRSMRTRPNWGPSTYWPWRTTNRRTFATVYSETGISWTVLDFLRIPCKPRSLLFHIQNTMKYPLEVGGCQNLCNFIFWCFQAKWVPFSCCGMLREKSIRRESALTPLGKCTNEYCVLVCSSVTWTATSGALLRRRSISTSGRLYKVFFLGSKIKQKLTKPRGGRG